MAKKKIVIKIQMNCQKCRSESMQLASAAGADSVSVEGDNKDLLVVVGDGIDFTKLTKKLRKKIGHAHISTLEDVKDKKEEKEEKKPDKVDCGVPIYPNCYPTPGLIFIEEPPSGQGSCTIM